MKWELSGGKSWNVRGEMLLENINRGITAEFYV